ncbi:fimbrillin family protein [Bacteroides heparinolyticus]|uniref:Fimbrillin family protein n=1 Tax=Prevotella heparinolytica TaxID=28113 RepID=A0A3P2ABR9_9BACE|nr:fimbrillin family protein [Bacteroides heparinolyticus]RRD92887.1 fimbrillin family protein [Bacteroides heparinolyticus]
MKTMKHLFLAGLALVALASCSRDETTGVDMTDAIGFRTSLGKATRAATTLANMGSFNVTAVPASGGANYFTDLAVTDGGGGTWNTASVYYWPEGSLNFTAYAPASISSLVAIDRTAQKITGFEVAATVASQKDVVAAFNSGGKADYGTSGVPMNFKHILSQVEVKAKCSNANLRVQVVGVKLGAINSKGDFAFPQTATVSSYSVPRANWTGLSTPKDYGVETGAAVTLTGAAQRIMPGDDNFMMIPQDLEAYNASSAPSGSYIAVLCRMDMDNGSGNYTPLYPTAATGYAYMAVGIGTEWLPGKKYVYTLEFGGATGGGNGVVPPNQDNPGGTTVPTTPSVPPGTPVLGSPIGFTVAMDNWSDDTSGITM